MRCAFESRQENLTLYPFPGLKVINIRGSNLLSLDLIVIGSFVTSLSDNNRLLELSLRDYPLDDTGLNGLMPCLPLVRTVTICARLIKDPKMYYNIAEACGQPKSRFVKFMITAIMVDFNFKIVLYIKASRALAFGRPSSILWLSRR
jgi:hypothetical protein